MRTGTQNLMCLYAWRSIHGWMQLELLIGTNAQESPLALLKPYLYLLRFSKSGRLILSSGLS